MECEEPSVGTAAVRHAEKREENGGEGERRGE